MKKRIEDLFRASGYALANSELDRFARFFALIEKHNDEFDLTRLRKPDDIIIKHFIDSVYFSRFIEPPSTLLDIGTGAGFPGIPIMIMRPDARVILAEPRSRRVEFLRLALRVLGLSKGEVYPHLVTDKSFFEVDGVITRALETADATLSRASHFLKIGGIAILLKGPGFENEHLSEENGSRYSKFLIKTYTLPGTDYRRTIAVYEKTTGNPSRLYRIMKNAEETAGKPISSPENHSYKALLRLTDIDGIKKQKKILIAGTRLAREILADNSLTKETCVIFDGFVDRDSIFAVDLASFAAAGNLLILKKSLYNRLDLYGTESPILCVRIPEAAEWDCNPVEGPSLMLPFQDPGNVGSAVRSAAAFGIKNIILLKEAASPFHPKAVRASAGAVFGVRILSGPSIKDIAALPEQTRKGIILLDKNGEDIRKFDFPRSFILLPGMEGRGVPDNLDAEKISIPISGMVESLNAAGAVTIALYEISRR